MVPTYEDIMLPLLKLFDDGREHSLSELHDILANQLKLTETDRRELVPSGRQTTFRNRVGWARTYMKKAKLLHSSRRAYYSITERGKNLLAESPERITAKLLMRYDEFVEFKSRRKTDSTREQSTHIDQATDSDKTPEEVLELSYQELRSELAKEVLDIVKTCSPDFFERLVIDLLINMGYGGSRQDAGSAVGRSGDGGIDGIINEDKLGLDIIYLQAKRWDNTVPVKEIRDFTGALASKKAKKGIFITTSSFPKSVYEFVQQIEYKIILIDGERLADLMIENNIGLSTINTYELKTIDLDYFEDN